MNTMTETDYMVTENSLVLPKRVQNTSSKLARIVAEEYKKHELGYYQLTKREKEILTCMALGMGSKEIADELFISKHTVDTHRKNIYRKTELKSIRDVVLFALIFELGV